jgi:peptidoglycan/LPS O-acetylase OafA/YrhL
MHSGYYYYDDDDDDDDYYYYYYYYLIFIIIFGILLRLLMSTNWKAPIRSLQLSALVASSSLSITMMLML